MTAPLGFALSKWFERFATVNRDDWPASRRMKSSRSIGRPARLRCTTPNAARSFADDGPANTG
jgi:hypothetical protein